ncbi:uncharacterized protein BX663DRAFT_540836 [Cokeromyces recurvatus]|uniref:uncharacterized protein n=1 Tax=Cokeromyces recurvatus TaxID=90255 RepID=UPI0022211744|nr:uncharacterized protein BX663DRAFT_540836 [Cokeromyces recurvatus]KAI7906249.1 hypothetical protein BX663DRAFT_540836 [Cokeromyces recurvatus]
MSTYNTTSLSFTTSTITNDIISPTTSSSISNNTTIYSSISSSDSTFIATPTTTTTTAITSTAGPSTSHIPGLDIPFTSDGAKKYLEDARHTSDIGSQFTICFIVGLICFLVFCFFRTRVPVLFSPRSNMKRHKPPELPNTFVGWIWPLLKINDEEMLSNVGLDALLMLKFITMSIKIFGICTLFGLTIFVPITMTSDISHLGANITAIDRVSITAIEEGSNKIIAYLVFAYIFTFITFFFLNQGYNDYVYLRAKYVLSQSRSLVARSIIVTGIPKELRSDRALANYYEQLGIGRVERCYVVRTVHRLNTLIKRRAQALNKLEEAYARYWGNPCKISGYDPDRILDDADMYKRVLELADKRQKTSYDKTFFKGLIEPSLGKTVEKTRHQRPKVRIGGLLGIGGKKVDAIEYYTKLFDDLDQTVIECRQTPYYEMTNVGFVTFEDINSAIIASQIAINPRPFTCRTSMACEPRDVLWSAIAIRGRERIIREIIIWTITVLLCLTWFIPVGAVSSLLSIDTIKRLNSRLGEKLENNPVTKLVLGSFVPPLILNIFTSVLPIFFDSMGYIQGLRSRSAIAESTLSKQYFFLIFFTLIFYSVVGTTVMTLVTDFTNNPKEIPTFLANVLPSLAPFFINYTILQSFLVMPLNLLLLGAIIIRGFNHLFICKTPRQHAENRAPWAFNYGIGYPVPLLVFAIVFEYSLISPLVLLFGTVYFCFTFVVYKYQFLYVYFRPYEAAGKLWTMVIPRIIFTLVLFQLTMMGLFLLRGSYILGGLIVPLIFFTFLFRYILNRAYERNAFNLPIELLVNYKRDKKNIHSNGDDSSSSSSSSSSSDSEDERSLTTSQQLNLEEKNRWKRAAISAVHLKDDNMTEKNLVRPHHRKVILDEDDYEATPDALTDYRQPPMKLNSGILDAGLKRYGNPLLVGVLPQLWLPVKIPDSDQQQQQRSNNNYHKNDGGRLAQHLAEILRKVEHEKAVEQQQQEGDNDNNEDTMIKKARIAAHQNAASIVAKTPQSKTTTFQSLFRRCVFKQHQETNKDIEGASSIIDLIPTHESSSRSSIHQTYYHHRKSHVARSLDLENRPDMIKDTIISASSPAILKDS